MKHEWIPSTLGHGEFMCKNCLMTNREAWVLRDECPNDLNKVDPHEILIKETQQ